MEVNLMGTSEKEKTLDLMGRRIARFRKERRWKRADLAQCLGVTRERLGHWERGEHAPPLEFLVKLVQTFQVSMDELVLGERLTDDETREARWHVTALNRLLMGELASRAAV